MSTRTRDSATTSHGVRHSLSERGFPGEDVEAAVLVNGEGGMLRRRREGQGRHGGGASRMRLEARAADRDQMDFSDAVRESTKRGGGQEGEE